MLAAALAFAFLARPPSSGTSAETRSAPSASAASSALRVLVRVDTRAAEEHIRFADLVRNVRAIWKPYADIVFADTADLGGDGFDDELELVVTDRPGSAASGAAALGWITFVGPGRPASVVTVSVATARSLMAHDSWMGRRFDQLPPDLFRQFVTRATSWSAAHEIGHYLLRTSAHSTGGLMKAQLTAAEVMQNGREWVRLAPHEVETLRRRASRTDLAKLAVQPPDDEP